MHISQLFLVSGLDATAATTLMTTLRSMADNGKTIIAVIHQPSQHVFAMFDDLLLVSEGKQMYMGEVSRARVHMNQYGCRADAEIGTAGTSLLVHARHGSWW